MTSQKRSYKASSKKLTVAAPPVPSKNEHSVSRPTGKQKAHLDDKTFKKELKQFMKENEILMRNLSKR